MLKMLEKMGGAGLFLERWGGDGYGFELPAADLGFVEVQPGERLMNESIRGESGDACVVGGGHF